MFSYYADGCLIAVYVTSSSSNCPRETRIHLLWSLRGFSLFCMRCDIFLICFEGLRFEGVHRFKILSVQTNYFGNLWLSIWRSTDQLPLPVSRGIFSFGDGGFVLLHFSSWLSTSCGVSAAKTFDITQNKYSTLIHLFRSLFLVYPDWNVFA